MQIYDVVAKRVVYQEQQEQALQKQWQREWKVYGPCLIQTCSLLWSVLVFDAFSFSHMSLMNAGLTSVWTTASGTWGLNILCSGSSGSIPSNFTRWVPQKQQDKPLQLQCLPDSEWSCLCCRTWMGVLLPLLRNVGCLRHCAVECVLRAFFLFLFLASISLCCHLSPF